MNSHAHHSRTFADPKAVLRPKLWILGVGFLLAILLFILDALGPANRVVIKITGVDAVAYFATARSLLFDRDFDLSNEFAVLRPTTSAARHAIDPRGFLEKQPKTGLFGSPYAIGSSVLEIPFLAAGTVVDRMAGRPAEGYSRGAVTAFYLGLIVFVTIGLLCVQDALSMLAAQLFPTASEKKRSWTSLVIAVALLPATTLGYYTFSPISHAAGFMSVALFFLTWMRVRESEAVGSWLILGFFGGLATLCRWQNLLLLAAPLVADLLTWKDRTRGQGGFAGWLRVRGAYATAAIVTLFPQFVQWKAIYGTYLFAQHTQHGFLQLPPRFIPEVLFSSRHGWFVWTPACLLCVGGLVWGCFRHMALFLPWTLALAAEVAVIGSSIQYWHNGSSFGIRMLTCSLPISAMGLFYLLMRTTALWRAILWVALGAAAAYTSVFAVQFRLGLVPDTDYLTFSELVSDKFAIPRAYRRRVLARHCDALLEQGNPKECLRILDDGIRRFGDDRFLLSALVRARGASGNKQAAAQAQARLDAFLARRLW